VLTASNDGSLRIWDADACREIATLTGERPWKFGAFSPDDRKVIARSQNSAVLWDPASGLPPAELMGHDTHFPTNTLSRMLSDYGCDVAFRAEDGAPLALSYSSKDSKIFLYDGGPAGPPAALEGHTEGIRTARFSSDGQRVVSGSDDRTARVWDIRTRRTIAVLPADHPVMSACLGLNGRRAVTGCRNGTLRVWDVGSGNRSELVDLTASGLAIGRFSDVQLSPDGQNVLAIAGASGFICRIPVLLPAPTTTEELIELAKSWLLWLDYRKDGFKPPLPTWVDWAGWLDANRKPGNRANARVVADRP
jgi:WD40 repeat protein